MQKVTLISQKTDDQLNLLQKKLGASKVALLEKALDQFAREQFKTLEDNKTLAARKDTSKALLEEIQEQILWNDALHVGVDE